MRTEKQIQASRANGAKSRGPVTTQGKANSRRNALRHGILADTVVLEEETREAFLDLLRDLYDHYVPQGPVELHLVDTMAAAEWRMNRIRGYQKSLQDHDVRSQPPYDGDQSLRGAQAMRTSPDTLHRYEISYDRQYSRALRRLMQLRAQNSAPQTASPAPDPPSITAPEAAALKTPHCGNEPGKPLKIQTPPSSMKPKFTGHPDALTPVRVLKPRSVPHQPGKSA